MTELNDDARALIDVARAAEEPTTEDRMRVHGALVVRVAALAGASTVVSATAGAAATGTAATATAGATGWASAALMGKWMLMGALATTAVGTGVLAARGELGSESVSPVHATAARWSERVVPERIAAGAATPEDDGEAASADTESADDGQAEAPSPSAARPSAGGAGAAASEAPSPLDSELALLREAQQHMQSGRADRALQLLDQHQVDHADGVLSQERQAARVFALCQLGRVAEARAAAAAFLRGAPNSPLADRVRGACGGSR